MKSAAFGNIRKSALALSVLAAICGTVAIPAVAATAATGLVTIAHPTILSRGDAVIGALPMTQPMQIVVGLKMRDREGLDAFIKSNAKVQAVGKAPMLMSHDDFLAQHAPTEVQAQVVANYLARMGFTNVVIAPNRLLVSANGTAASAANAFLTTFSQVRTYDGRIAFANNSDAHIPAALQGSVEAVVGLQTVHVAHTTVQLGGKLPPRGGVHTDVPNNYVFMYQYPSIYGTTGSKGARATDVGILSDGDLTSTIADLNEPSNASFNCFYSNTGYAGAGGGACRTIPTKVVDVGTGPWTGVTDDVEWHLDSQAVAGITGQYSNTTNNQINRIVFYNMPSLANTNILLGINQAVNDDVVRVFNGSLGECELSAAPAPTGDGSAALADNSLMAGVAQGQTFVFSTGDKGSDECQDTKNEPQWPANSQYVVAVAGTALTDTGDGLGDPVNPAWSSETVWVDSGGSQSTYEPKPSWQTLWTGPNRGVADVAFNASNTSKTIVYINDGTYNGDYGVSGTSVAAPLFSGMWASMLTSLGNGYGFAGPLIYKLPAADFHDVTVGNNGGETAAVGYDLASGRGSMQYNLAVVDAKGTGNKPPTANFSFSTTGLTASFTDNSTDSDGTIKRWKWDFGDGSAVTAANSQQDPVHVYTAGGTYKVNEIAYDNDGSAAGASKNVIVAATGPVQLLGNTGFESGTVPWTVTMNASHPVIACGLSEPAQSGSCAAWLDGTGASHTDTLIQQVTIPTGKTTATLAFSLHIDTLETRAAITDVLRVQVTNTADKVLATLATYSNKNAATGYASHSVDMSPWIGQTVKVKFLGIENATLQTSFVLDDVTLNVQ